MGSCTKPEVQLLKVVEAQWRSDNDHERGEEVHVAEAMGGQAVLKPGAVLSDREDGKWEHGAGGCGWTAEKEEREATEGGRQAGAE